jgi:VCBS repeat-containing protein
LYSQADLETSLHVSASRLPAAWLIVKGESSFLGWDYMKFGGFGPSAVRRAGFGQVDTAPIGRFDPDSLYVRTIAAKQGLDPVPGIESMSDATEGADSIVGTDGDDVIDGLGGNDFIEGLGGSDLLIGGDGVDWLFGGEGDDVLRGGAGDDSLRDDSGNDQLFGEDGNDYLSAGYDSVDDLLIDGGAGDDEILASFNQEGQTRTALVLGGTGHDRIQGQAGGLNTVVTIDAGEGNDFLTLIRSNSNSADYVVTLGAGADFLRGAISTSTLSGLSITDFETGDAGDAIQMSLAVLTGWDRITNPFATGHLRLVQSGADTLLQVDLNGTAGGASFVTQTAFVNVSATDLTARNLGGYASDGSVVLGQAIAGTTGVDVISGTMSADVITGGDGDDILFGAAGDELIEGGEGRDELYSELGNDIVHGEGGNDYLYADGGGSDQLFGGDGNDQLFLTRTSAGGAGVVVMEGEVGNDRLSFTSTVSGLDVVMRGGEGIDDFDVQSAGGTVEIDAGAGDDRLVFSIDTTAFEVSLGAGADTVTLNSSTPFTTYRVSIADFAAGFGGDNLILNFLPSRLPGWDGISNPFDVGFLRLVSFGGDTVLQIDRDGAGPFIFVDLVTFRDIDRQTFTADNFGGYQPNLGNVAPVITLSDGTTSFDERTNAVEITTTLVDVSLTLADPDGNTLESVVVAFTGGFLPGEDRLQFDHPEPTDFYGDINGSYDAATGTLTLTSAGGMATMVQWENAAGSVAYVNSSQEPSAAPRFISFTASDGQVASQMVTKQVNIVPRNDQPSGGDSTITLVEDGTADIVASDFHFTDVDGDNFLAVTVTAISGGSLWFDADGSGGGAAIQVAALRTLTVAELADGRLFFRPAADGFGIGLGRVGFTVRDDGGTANGGRNTDPVANSISFDVDALNDAPASTQLNGDVVSWTEGDAVVRLDAGADTAVSDVDSANFADGTLTVAITAGLEAGQDQLVVQSSGGTSTVGNAVLVDGNQIATVSGGANGMPLVFAFSAAASPVTVTTLLQAISYLNTGGDAPVTGLRTVTWTLADGDGGVTVLTTTVDVIGAENIAVAQPDSLQTNEVVAITGSVFDDNGNGADSDPDGPPLSVAEVNGSAAYVGQQIVLSSGALLTLNADGTYVYNPNGAFDALAGPASGATNMSASDSFTYTLAGGGTATVTVTVNGVDSDDVLEGTSGSDQLYGREGNDQLYGREGNDTLYGGTGTNRLEGGTGDDWYYVESATDLIVELADQGTGDRVFTSVSYALSAGAQIEIFSTSYNAGTAAINLTGNELGNLIYGNAGSNLLNGREGNDQLYGREGNDTLYGGTGTNRLEGGTGDDWYYVESATDLIVELADQGTGDRVFTSVSYALSAGAQIEIFSTSYNAGTAAINLTGNELGNLIYGNAGSNLLNGREGNDQLYGREGNDTLYGGTGTNRLEGGTGDDWYYVESATDLIVELADQGTGDRVFTSVSYALSAGAQIEIFSTSYNAGTAAINLTGNELGNLIYGNAGSNLLNGREGNDQLYGREGNDTLYGGTGTNRLEGGTGDDWYYVESATDLIVELADQGTGDRVFTSVSYALSAGAQIEIFSTSYNAGTAAINLTGNELGNLIYGNAGSNLLNGREGNDQLYGREGNDTLYGGTGTNRLEGGTGDDWYYVESATDLIVELADQGTGDRVFTSVSYALSAGAQIEIFSTSYNAGTAAINLTGNELGNLIYGNAGSNLLNGREGNDQLYGREGNDTFAFTTALGAGNVDFIGDFSPGEDTILLGGATGQPFAVLASGALSSEAFHVGAQAIDADDRIIYDLATGTIFYDADGSGVGAAVVFARVGLGTGLSAESFTVSGPANNLPTVTTGGTASVAENNAVGAVVYQAGAVDADGDSISYRLSGDDQTFFTIDANGVVRAVGSFDFEARSNYEINVEAYDSSGNGGIRTVAVSVTDVNEGPGPTLVLAETASANNSTANAQTISRAVLAPSFNPNLDNDDLPSVTIRGAISPATDSDFYSISLQAGEKLILDIDSTPGDLDIVVRIYDSGGNQIGYVDDAPVDPGSGSDYPGFTYDSFLTFRASTSGTYYFSVESYGPPETWNPEEDPPGQGQTSGTYDLNVSIAPPATPDEILQEDIEALISGSSWPTTSLTYSFPDSISDYPDSPADDTTGFAAFNATQQAATAQLLQLIGNATGLTFTNVTGTAQESEANLRYAENDQDGAAYAYYPGGQIGGTAWFNHSDFNNPIRGSYGWMGILHETGHALGLKHGHEFPAISVDRDSLEYTVMTYRAYPGGDIEGGYGNETYGYPQTLMMLDIAALQQLYGANYNFNSGNSVYTWNPTTGQMSINGAGQSAPGGNRVLMTVWDGGGNDTYDLASYANGASIDLRPGEWTRTSTAQLANLGDGRLARGNVANALLFNDDPRSLIENAIGGAGGDFLIANQAANRLTGNAGGDTFRWVSSTDAGIGALADTVTDFDAANDLINLTSIDARPGTPGDDAFTFIGTNAFSGASGELRYEVIGGDAHIFADLNGDRIGDMEIILDNVTFLGSASLFL